MRKHLLILSFILLSLIAFSQRHIEGIVVNVATGAPVVSASVFISNTLKGTTTNAAGQFQLNDVPVGKHNLVISSIGYETNVFPFSEAKLSLRIKVERTLKVKEL